MESAAFESLTQKIEQAVARIESLKGERDGLQAELAEAREALTAEQVRALGLEEELTGARAEVETLRNDLNERSENLNQAGDRVRDLVSRLEAALV